MNGHDPLIEIIIPNWNGKDMLAHCLLSLRRQTFSDFCITVVDNGSRDGSIELVTREFPGGKTDTVSSTIPASVLRSTRA